MISVVVYINNQPILLKTARNMGQGLKAKPSVPGRGRFRYMDEAGNEIWHNREDGAAKLAIKMLRKYEEPAHG